MLSSDVTKSQRATLRRIEAHILHMHRDQGAQSETLGMVEVVSMPGDASSLLNYIAPRRSAAWVSTSALRDGLDRLKAIGCPPRVVFYDRLLPPVFKQSLVEIGLQLEQEESIYALGLSANEAKSTSSGARSVHLWVSQANHAPVMGRLHALPTLATGMIDHIQAVDQGSIGALLLAARRAAASRSIDFLFMTTDSADVESLGFEFLGHRVIFGAAASEKRSTGTYDRVAQPLPPPPSD